MLAWIFRIFKKVINVDKNLSKYLFGHEIERGETALMLLIPKEFFKAENDDKLKQLRPIFDCHCLIRAKTKVGFWDDKYDFKFPNLLPSHHPVVRL